MDLKVLLTVFTAVFIAELGDKTQLATLLFAADKEVSKFTVFLGASLALIVASGIGVLAGGLIALVALGWWLHYLAGAGYHLGLSSSNDDPGQTLVVKRGRPGWARFMPLPHRPRPCTTPSSDLNAAMTRWSENAGLPFPAGSANVSALRGLWPSNPG